jgi:hypothetical protein
MKLGSQFHVCTEFLSLPQPYRGISAVRCQRIQPAQCYMRSELEFEVRDVILK